MTEYDGPDWVWHVKYVQDDPECLHIFPQDWHFGGATGEDPRADPRWLPSTYLFIDRMFQGRCHTSEPFCDHDAVGPFREKVNSRVHRDHEIFFVMVQRPGSDKSEPIYTRTEEAISGAHSG